MIKTVTGSVTISAYGADAAFLLTGGKFLILSADVHIDTPSRLLSSNVTPTTVENYEAYAYLVELSAVAIVAETSIQGRQAWRTNPLHPPPETPYALLSTSVGDAHRWEGGIVTDGIALVARATAADLDTTASCVVRYMVL